MRNVDASDLMYALRKAVRLELAVREAADKVDAAGYLLDFAWDTVEKELQTFAGEIKKTQP